MNADLLAAVLIVGVLLIGAARYHRAQRAAERMRYTVEPTPTWNSTGEAVVEWDYDE